MLNITNNKVIKLARMCALTPQQLSLIDDDVSDDDSVNWWGIANELIQTIDLPHESFFVDGLRNVSINNIDECMNAVAWHLDGENIRHCLGQLS